MTRARGIDVSHHNGEIDWPRVKRAGYSFAFVKATEGTSHTDHLFARNAAEALNADLHVGAYHFGRPLFDPIKQATHFAATIYKATTLPPVLDIERYTELRPPEVVAWCEAFLAELRALTDRAPIVYTGPNYWRYELGSTRRLSGHDLWIVKYSRAHAPPTIDGFNSWRFWQWSHKGTVDGISGHVDLNYFNGTDRDLDVYATGQAVGFEHAPITIPDLPAGLPTYQLDDFEAVQKVQALLVAAGHNPAGLIDRNGVPDGIFGSKTERQLYAYTSARKLPHSARELHPSVLWALITDGIKR